MLARVLSPHGRSKGPPCVVAQDPEEELAALATQSAPSPSREYASQWTTGADTSAGGEGSDSAPRKSVAASPPTSV